MQRRRFITSGLLTLGGMSVASTSLTATAGTTDSTGIPFYLVDAFSSSVFAGNPAPVVVLQHWLPN